MEEQNQPAPAPAPAPQPTSKLTIALVLILTAIVAAFLAYYFTQKYFDSKTSTQDQPPSIETPNSEIPSTDEDKEISQPTAKILMANLDRNDGNYNSLDVQVVSHPFPKGKDEELANFTANIQGHNSIYFYDNKIYYITLSTQLGSYDLTTGKTEVINIPGVDNSNEGYIKSYSISDFALDDGKVVYMKGECTETLKCTVGLYDLATKENKIVLDDLMKVIKPIIMNASRIESFDAETGIAVITDNSGDAGWGMSVYYDLNVNNGNIVKTDSAEILACGDEPDSMIGPCTAEQEAKNQHYDELLAKRFIMCGDVKVDTSEYWKLIIEGGEESEEIEDASFVACQ